MTRPAGCFLRGGRLVHRRKCPPCKLRLSSALSLRVDAQLRVDAHLNRTIWVIILMVY